MGEGMLDDGAQRTKQLSVADHLAKLDRELDELRASIAPLHAMKSSVDGLVGRITDLASATVQQGPVIDQFQAYLTDVKARQPEREEWDKTTRAQLSALTNRNTLEDYHKAVIEARQRNTIRALGTLLGGAVVPVLALYLSQSSGRLNGLPLPVIALIVVGGILGFAGSRWLTADVPPAPPQLP